MRGLRTSWRGDRPAEELIGCYGRSTDVPRVYDPNHSRLIFKRFEPSPLYTKIVEARFSLSTRRYLRILWVIAVLVVIISSLLPSGSFPMRALGKLGIGDKLLHATAYAVLGFLPA